MYLLGIEYKFGGIILMGAKKAKCLSVTFWLLGLCLYETHSVQPSLWDTVYLLVNLPPQHFYAKYFIEEFITKKGF